MHGLSRGRGTLMSEAYFLSKAPSGDVLVSTNCLRSALIRATSSAVGRGMATSGGTGAGGPGGSTGPRPNPPPGPAPRPPRPACPGAVGVVAGAGVPVAGGAACATWFAGALGGAGSAAPLAVASDVSAAKVTMGQRLTDTSDQENHRTRSEPAPASVPEQLLKDRVQVDAPDLVVVPITGAFGPLVV